MIALVLLGVALVGWGCATYGWWRALCANRDLIDVCNLYEQAYNALATGRWQADTRPVDVQAWRTGNAPSRPKGETEC